jgi:hypothetical protein
MRTRIETSEVCYIPLGHIFEDALLLERVSDGHGGCAGHSVSGVGAALKCRVSVRDYYTCTLRAHTIEPGLSLSVSSLRLTMPLSGKPLARPLTTKPSVPLSTLVEADPRAHLGHQQDVRPHARVFDRKVLARAPKAALHLVNDEQYVVLVTDLTQTAQERRWCGHVTTLAEDRLDEDCRGVKWRCLLLQEQLKLVETLAHEFVLAHVRRAKEVVPVRERCREHAWLRESGADQRGARTSVQRGRRTMSGNVPSA